MVRFAVVAVLLAIRAIVSPAAADTASGQDKADFTALEARWLHAIAAHDTTALSRILASDFTDTSWNGRVRTRADLLARANAPGPRPEQRLSDIEVRRFGNVVLVTGQNNISGMGPHEIALRFSDLFVWRQGRWQAVHAQETPITKGGL